MHCKNYAENKIKIRIWIKLQIENYDHNSVDLSSIWETS